MEKDRWDHEEYQRIGCGKHPHRSDGGLESISSISKTKGDHKDSEIKKSVFWDGISKDIKPGAAECVEGSPAPGALWISKDSSKGQPGSSREC